MAALAADFRDLAEWAEGTDPLYARLCREAAEDDAILDLASTVPDDRQAPHMLLAAVHYLLERLGDHRLAEYYPTLTEAPLEPDDDCFPLFRAFAVDRAADLRPLLETRRTQTNAVRRSTVLYPAIAHVQRAVGDEPLALVELGPSAGLNLRFDQYRYDYAGEQVGHPGAPVTLAAAVRDGDPPLPLEPPAIHSRVGIDRNPLDVTDPEDAAWLRALVWPSQPERHALLSDALTAAAQDPPELVAGDAVERLPDVLASIPTDVPVCLVSTLVRYQLPDAVDAALQDRVASAMAERDLQWVTGRPSLGDGEATRLDWVHADDGAPTTEHIASFAPHGEWLAWHT